MTSSIYCAGLYDSAVIPWECTTISNESLPRIVEAHACQHTAHISEAGDHARHRIIGVNLILQINKARVFYCDERFKNFRTGMRPSPTAT